MVTTDRAPEAMDFKNISIFDSDYQMPYPHKDGAKCCTFGIDRHRCKKIRAIDNHHSSTTAAERARIDGLLNILLDNPFALGLDGCTDLAEEWTVANLCIFHGGPSDVRAVRNEKLKELGWKEKDIETRATKMNKETAKSNPLRVGEGVYTITDPAFGRHSMHSGIIQNDANDQEEVGESEKGGTGLLIGWRGCNS